jgi:hypothetical protein
MIAIAKSYCIQYSQSKLMKHGARYTTNTPSNRATVQPSEHTVLVYYTDRLVINWL